jgi:tRNA(fMet)-specific endonuclease VapC
VTLRYLLDTNIVLEPLKVPANPAVLEQIRQHEGSTALSATVWHELWFGCHRLPPSRRRSELEYYLNHILLPAMPILPYGAESAEWLANQRAKLVELGLPPPMADGQIAAVAAVNGLTLVTRNVGDFLHFSGLLIENWFTPTP